MQSEVNIYKGSHTIFLLLFTDSSKGNTFRVTAARLYNSSVQNLKYISLGGHSLNWPGTLVQGTTRPTIHVAFYTSQNNNMDMLQTIEICNPFLDRNYLESISSAFTIICMQICLAWLR